MKKIIIRTALALAITLVALLAIILVSLVVGSGFSVRTDVALLDYSLSENGDEIIIKTAISSSMGYIRDYKDEGGGDKPHYLKFYSAFGGPNGSIGAKDEFTLTLQPDDTEIYFYRGEQEYDLVLSKNELTGEWQKQ